MKARSGAIIIALLAVGGCSGGSGDGASAGAGGAGPGPSGAGGVGGGVPGLPGIVRGNTCYALCTQTSKGDAASPDWGFENGASCIVAGTPTAAGRTCTTGQPVPAPMTRAGRAGVVLSMMCYPLCETTKMPSDPKAPDWGYEEEASCVLPGTKTAVAQSCTTGMPLPDPSALDPRPGVVVLEHAKGVRECVPLCTASTDPSKDPEKDDWDYEFGGSCVIPTSPTSFNQACQTGQPVPAPPNVPGVVVKNGAGVSECVPLCVRSIDPALDPELDDWSYENNLSCVIPNSAPAVTNLGCTTGAPLPAPEPRPGVVVKGSDDQLTCVANCVFFKTPTQEGANDDGLADDWAWENSDSCIIPGTVTSANTKCTTLMPIPAPEPRPGIYVNGDPVVDSCKWSACVPLCRVVSAPSKPDHADWGYEDNTSCVLPNSPTARQIPKAVENHGYEVPPRKCTWGVPLPDYLKPPALDAAKTVQGYFRTNGAELRDPYGAPFIIRGVNNSHGWYDICGQYSAFEALDNIAATGANSVRVGWAFESIDPVGPLEGDPEKAVIGTNAKLLAEILYRIVELEMIPILALNDSTGQTTTDWPKRMAEFLLEPEYKQVLLAYEPYLLIGISNEWNGTEFFTGYSQAVQLLRSSGIHHTLVITANDWGQGCDSILTDGTRLVMDDPDMNILFDMHIYNYLTVDGAHGGDATFVQNCMDRIKALNLPLLVGEFGHTHSEKPVQWQTVIARANANDQGYAPWLWYGDTEFEALNMNDTWEGPLSSWGDDLLPITGAKATIFQ